MLDYIIVGQGIAGSMLSWFLLKAGRQICVIDQYNPSSASNIASGISNPVTGRKFVKTWLADELLPFAESAYREFENLSGQSFLRPLSIIKLFDSVKAQNDWSARCATPGYLPYLKNEAIVYTDRSKVNNEFGGFEINGGMQLDVAAFLRAYRKFLNKQQLLIEEKFEIPALKQENGFVSYKDKQAYRIIFCEGAAASENPYFKHLPFVPDKGECLIVHIPDFYNDRIINGEVFMMPMKKPDEYYIGSTHDWYFENVLPSEKRKQELITGLNSLLKAPYKILAHHAAIRPAVKDRRPFIGFSRRHPSIGIFNGMGTKGISLAPYFANHFVNHLVQGAPLMKEVAINRFLS